MSPDHPERLWIQMYLVLGLLYCYSGGLSSLLRIQTLQTAVLERIPPDHPVHSSFLDLLRYSQKALFKNIEAEERDNDLAIELITKALEVALPDHHDRPKYQFLLAKKHLERWHEEKNAADLDRSIELLEGNLEDITGDRDGEDHFLLASALRKRGNILQDVNDLDRSIKIFEELVKVPPYRYKDKPSLALAIACHWNLTRDSTHLERFIELYEAGINPFRTLRLLDDSDDFRSDWLDDGFSQICPSALFGAIIDTNHCNPVRCRIDLALALDQRWQRFNDVTDLERLIKAYQEVVEHHPHGHDEIRTALASALTTWCELRHNITDLRQLVKAYETQLTLRPNYNQHIQTDLDLSMESQPGQHESNLSAALQAALVGVLDRFGSLEFLDFPLSVLEALRPNEDKNSAYFDVLILPRLLKQYAKYRERKTLDKAVTVSQTLFMSICHTHSLFFNAVSLMATIVNHLVDAYDRSGRLRPIEQAANLIKSCITNLPDGLHQDITKHCHTIVEARRVPLIVVFNRDENPFGRGGFAEVYRGFLNGRPVAMKTPRASPRNAQQKKRFLKEIHLWYRVIHQNILPVLGVHEEGDKQYVISPWCSNGNARNYLQTHSSHNKIRLLRQVAEALLHLHTFFPVIVHGDIKGDNVLIDDNGDALLCDFGLSRLESLDGLTGFTRTTVDLAGAGTCRFMAPELWPDDDADDNGQNTVRSWAKTTRSDVYAFGCLIYQIVSGKEPFSHVRLDPKVMVLVLDGRRPERPPEMKNDDLWSLCTDCWAQEATSRPTTQNIVERLQELEKLSDFFPM